MPLTKIIRERTDLAQHEVDHLARLLASWQLIADLSFADLLLWCPVEDGHGFVCLAQMRPYTAQTLHPEDWFGRVLRPEELPVVDRAYNEAKSWKRVDPVLMDGTPIRLEAIPVRVGERVVAVLTKEGAPLKDRRLGQLEQNYLECASALGRMVADGSFPFRNESLDPELAPRVGDGLVRLDRAGRVMYASPNAMSAYRRLGIVSNVEGEKLADLGINSSAPIAALRLGVPAESDMQLGRSVVLQRALPLLEGPRHRVTGALVLLRDVTQLRDRERELQRQEAMVREVHHRVKNNLQTIASLLRLQARRLPAQARQELEEAIRRIASIALVHDTLSKDSSQSVEFAEVASRLVKMVSEGLIHQERNIYIQLDGDPGRLSSELATPLAVVMVELLQNAVNHAFDSSGGLVTVSLSRPGDRLRMVVEDDGKGFQQAEAVGHVGLGLQIVRELVESEMGGTIDFEVSGGTTITIEIPAAQPERLVP
jgi:two-component sensor histidine kinase